MRGGVEDVAMLEKGKAYGWRRGKGAFSGGCCCALWWWRSVLADVLRDSWPAEAEWRTLSPRRVPRVRMLARLCRAVSCLGCASCGSRIGTGASPTPPAWSRWMIELTLGREMLRVAENARLREVDAAGPDEVRAAASDFARSRFMRAYRSSAFASGSCANHPLTRLPQLSLSTIVSGRPRGGSYGPL